MRPNDGKSTIYSCSRLVLPKINWRPEVPQDVFAPTVRDRRPRLRKALAFILAASFAEERIGREGGAVNDP